VEGGLVRDLVVGEEGLAIGAEDLRAVCFRLEQLHTLGDLRHVGVDLRELRSKSAVESLSRSRTDVHRSFS
jgi:hypothetical protein